MQPVTPAPPPSPMTTLSISARTVALAASMMAKNDIRYYINGVYIEPHPVKGVVAVGTDGHMLAIAHDPDGSIDKPAIFSLSPRTVAMLKTNKTGKVRVVGGKLEVTNIADVVQHIQPEPYELTGKYPDWRKVLPAADELEFGLAACFNLDYLKAIPSALFTGLPGVHCFRKKSDPQTATTSVCVFEPADGTKAVFVIMPMKDMAVPLEAFRDMTQAKQPVAEPITA